MVRAGFEGAYKSLRFRAGYSYATSPYKKTYATSGYTESRHNATAGLGYRGKRFYADLAYIFGMSKDASFPYADFVVKNRNMSHSILVTLGFRISKDPQQASKPKKPKMKF